MKALFFIQKKVVIPLHNLFLLNFFKIRSEIHDVIGGNCITNKLFFIKKLFFLKTFKVKELPALLIKWLLLLSFNEKYLKN